MFLAATPHFVDYPVQIHWEGVLVADFQEIVQGTAV